MTKKQRIKKIISLFLCVVMVLGCITVVDASSLDDTYDIIRSNVGTGGKVNLGTITLKKGESESLSFDLTVFLAQEYGWHSIKTSKSGIISITDDSSEYGDIEIYGKKAGTVDVTIKATNILEDSYYNEDSEGVVDTYVYTVKVVDKSAQTSKTSLSSCSVSIANAKYSYTGKAINVAVTVKKGSSILKKGTHYTVSYSGNKNVGKATVTITGKGNYTGSVKKTFDIVPSINKTNASVKVGKTLQLTVKSSSEITYKSSSTAIATVNAKGLIKAKKAGVATITATSNGKSVTCKVTVTSSGSPSGSSGSSSGSSSSGSYTSNGFTTKLDNASLKSECSTYNGHLASDIKVTIPSVISTNSGFTFDKETYGAYGSEICYCYYDYSDSYGKLDGKNFLNAYSKVLKKSGFELSDSYTLGGDSYNAYYYYTYVGNKNITSGLCTNDGVGYDLEIIYYCNEYSSDKLTIQYPKEVSTTDAVAKIKAATNTKTTKSKNVTFTCYDGYSSDLDYFNGKHQFKLSGFSDKATDKIEITLAPSDYKKGSVITADTLDPRVGYGFSANLYSELYSSAPACDTFIMKCIEKTSKVAAFYIKIRGKNKYFSQCVEGVFAVDITKKAAGSSGGSSSGGSSTTIIPITGTKCTSIRCINGRVKCSGCSGRGYNYHAACKSTGRVPVYGGGYVNCTGCVNGKITCSKCNGLKTEACSICGGDGYM